MLALVMYFCVLGSQTWNVPCWLRLIASNIITVLLRVCTITCGFFRRGGALWVPATPAPGSCPPSAPVHIAQTIRSPRTQMAATHFVIGSYLLATHTLMMMVATTSAFRIALVLSAGILALRSQTRAPTQLPHPYRSDSSRPLSAARPYRSGFLQGPRTMPPVATTIAGLWSSWRRGKDSRTVAKVLTSGRAPVGCVQRCGTR